MRQTHGSTAKILNGQNLIASTDERTRAFYIFTTKDRPAHREYQGRNQQLMEDVLRRNQ